MASVASPIKAVSSPSRSNRGASKLWMVSSRSNHCAAVFARPGRDAQTWGATYFTSGSFGSSRRRRWATRKVKPQESISTATSGRSRAASAAVSSARRTTLG